MNEKFKNLKVKEFFSGEDDTRGCISEQLNKFFREHPEYTLIDIKYSTYMIYDGAFILYREG